MVDAKRELDELHREIAQLDAQLVVVLDKRARAARRIGELRRAQPAAPPLGDHAAIRHLAARSSGDMPQEPLLEILGSVFAACLALELPVAIGFVGPEGGPVHSAARGRFGQTARLAQSDSIEAALEQVARKRAEFAVVPFETSADGPVHSTIRALVVSDLRIVEVLEAPFDLHLMNRSGSLVDVRRVAATAADRALCHNALAELAPRATVVDVAQPEAACRAALEEPETAALVLEALGLPAGLAIARRGVLDAGAGRLRFAVVGVRPSGRTGHEVTSVAFGPREPTGSLAEVLKVFAERGVEITKIQSLPSRGGATWTYLVYAELRGHFIDRPLVMAFEEIKRTTSFFKVLGSYPSP